MVEIDGGFGEGGGQIIRTALSLSALSGVPFRIRNIRGKRPRPGLRAQHVAAVRAIRAISGARVEGDAIDSRTLGFAPGTVKGGAYTFDIGTAGSTTLVLETLLPPLLFAGTESHLILKGGTHVPISPPFDFIGGLFFPLLALMGIRAAGSVRAYGFYPRGGGEIEVHVRPCEGGLSGLTLMEEKEKGPVSGVSVVANLPLSIAERQREAALETLRTRGLAGQIGTLSAPSPGRGTYVFLKAEGVRCMAGSSSIGVRGKRAETVGAEAAQDLSVYLKRVGCLDPHLADQIVVYLALAQGRSVFTTTEVTRHLVTNLEVIKMFLGVPYVVEGEIGSAGKVSVTGAGYCRSLPR